MRILILSFVISQFGLSQNLVPNGSFEEFSSCPTNNRQLFKAKHWKGQPSDGPDFYHACAYETDTNSYAGVPLNFFSYLLYAKTGVGLGGGFALNGLSSQFREYLKTKLTRPLSVDEFVYVDYYLVSDRICKYQVRSFDLHFSNSETEVSANYDRLNLEPHIYNTNGYLADTIVWQKVSGLYKAKGGEQHITIGNFTSDEETIYKINPNPEYNYDGAYLLLDDISVIPLDSISGGIPANAGPDHNIFTNDSVFIGQNMSGNFCKWYHNGSLLPNTEFGFHVKPTAAVNEYVVVQNLGGVIDSDTAYVYVKDASLKPLSKQVISVSPNPSNGSFNIQFDDLDVDMTSLRVTDINGKEIFNKEMALLNKQVQLQLNEANGIYLLYVHTSKGEEVHKLVVQH